MGWCPDVPAFRLVAPTATYVEVVFRDHPAGQRQETRPMTSRVAGERRFWQWSGEPTLPCYQFRVHLRDRTLTIADPWATAVCQRKLARSKAWSVAWTELAPFDWQGCESASVAARDAVILEVHVGDQTMLASSAGRPGSLTALRQSLETDVGLGHARALGANVSELLPMAAWPVDEGKSLNHWGYMPSFMCAVSGRYGENWAAAPPGSWPDFDAGG